MPSNKRTQSVTSALSRRDFAKRAAAAIGAAPLAGTVPAFWRTANAADTLKVGFISPRSGPLAGFGEGDPYVIDLARKTLAKGFEPAARPMRSKSSIGTRNRTPPAPDNWRRN